MEFLVHLINNYQKIMNDVTQVRGIPKRHFPFRFFFSRSFCNPEIPCRIDQVMRISRDSQPYE